MDEKVLLLKEKINQADAVIIGAGAGLSTAAGFVYAGERFDRYTGGILGVLEPVYLDQPVHGRAKDHLQ